MEFKKSSDRFLDSTDRFTSAITGFTDLSDDKFSNPSDEASAKVDAFSSRMMIAGGNKHKTKASEIKKEIKEAKKREKKEIQEEKTKYQETERFSEEKQSERANKDNKKAKKKSEKKETRKAARRVAVGNFIKARKDVVAELGGGGDSTGDAFVDGRKGLAGTVLNVISPMHHLKNLGAKLATLIAPYVLLFMAAAIVVVIMVALVFDVLSPIVKAKSFIDNVISFFVGDDEEEEKKEDPYRYVDAALDQKEIDSIVKDSGCGDDEKAVIEFALSKVGSPYSQAERTSGTAFDCSSLAYYSWKKADVDVGFGASYPPTAADMAKNLEEKGYSVDTESSDKSLKSGDLIFYGGEANGRYKGIYHVVIYIGKGKVVEALNDECGVVYQNLRSENASMIARPRKEG